MALGFRRGSTSNGCVARIHTCSPSLTPHPRGTLAHQRQTDLGGGENTDQPRNQTTRVKGGNDGKARPGKGKLLPPRVSRDSFRRAIVCKQLLWRTTRRSFIHRMIPDSHIVNCSMHAQSSGATGHVFI
eukprot:scaffold1060_cov385-Pavlova_lutheri.AAC.21